MPTTTKPPLQQIQDLMLKLTPEQIIQLNKLTAPKSLSETISKEELAKLMEIANSRTEIENIGKPAVELYYTQVIEKMVEKGYEVAPNDKELLGFENKTLGKSFIFISELDRWIDCNSPQDSPKYYFSRELLNII